MKKLIIAGLVVLVALGSVSAQGFGPAQGFQPQAQMSAQTKTTIEGKLALVQGHPSIVVKDKTYFVRLPQFMYGFVDGLKEGANVKLEGYETAVPYAPNSFIFRASTLTLGGKSYDLSQFANGGMMGGMMGGRGSGRGSMGNSRGRW